MTGSLYMSQFVLPVDELRCRAGPGVVTVTTNGHFVTNVIAHAPLQISLALSLCKKAATESLLAMSGARHVVTGLHNLDSAALRTHIANTNAGTNHSLLTLRPARILALHRITHPQAEPERPPTPMLGYIQTHQ